MKFSIKGRWMKTTHIWFENDCTPESLKQTKGADAFLIHAYGADQFPGAQVVTKQYSLLTDLRQDLSEIKIRKTVKNEINRSERENVQVRYFVGQEIDDALLQSFDKMYCEMYEEKGMRDQHLKLNELKAYAQGGALLISVAYLQEEPIVYHSYVFDVNNTRLLHSCSNFRITDKEVKNQIGRANKYLHWKDLHHFQQRNVQSYDWGGVSSLENPNGIDVFKMSFGGTPVEYYNVFVPFSLRLKLISFVRGILK